jgi:hypothetical protein
MIVIGVGNVGMKLATLYSKDAILFSTAIQDTNNYEKFKVINVSDNGASKKFSTGIQIWEENYELLRESLKFITNTEVIVFSSFGGGSGSSSLRYLSNALLENGNKVLIVGVLPFKKEQLPPIANAVQSINNLIPVLENVSIMVFNNERLIEVFNNNWTLINKHIVEKVDYITNMLDKYNTSNYSPLTMDKSELYSVIFDGGFVDVSYSFLEEEAPQFEFGKMDKNVKNCLIGMFVDNGTSKEKVDSYHGTITKIASAIASKVPNSRMITGILRGGVSKTRSKTGVTDRLYITIISGMNPEKYLRGVERIKKTAIKKAEKHNETQKSSKILSSKDSKMLNI